MTKAKEATRGSASLSKVEQNGRRIYVGTIPVLDLFPCCHVEPYEATGASAGGGFQRLLDRKRAEAIAAYVCDGEGSIANGIVLFATDAARMEYDRRTKMVSWDATTGAFLVGDGQHRLWGFWLAATEGATINGKVVRVAHRVIVSVYEPRPAQEQARLFTDINTKQVPLPAPLLLRVKELAGRETDRDAALRVLFDRLGTDAKSPLRGAMSAARAVPGKIASTSFARAMAPVLRCRAWAEMDGETGYRVFRNYLSAWADGLVHGEAGAGEWLSRGTYLAAVCAVFPDALERALAIGPGLRPEHFAPLVGGLAALDPREDGRALPAGQLAERFREALRVSAMRAVPRAVEA